MSNNPMVKRFGRDTGKDPRAIMVIDSPGCSWRRCKFCAVHNSIADSDTALAQARYCFEQLNETDTKIQIVSSASFSDYSLAVEYFILSEIFNRPYIKDVYIEQRWSLREDVTFYRRLCAKHGVTLHAILGLEAVSYEKQQALGKDICPDINEAAKYYDHINLLLGCLTPIDAPYVMARCKQFLDDFLSCYLLFKRVSINVFEEVKGCDFKRDQELIDIFYQSGGFSQMKLDDRIHIYDSDPRAEDFGGIDTFER